MFAKILLKTLLVTYCMLMHHLVIGSDDEDKGNEGKFFFYWGWNRAMYSKSDIKFKGEDYDFELHNVRAKDRQTPFDIGTYLHPLKLTIPQTNFKIGYHFWDKYNICFGFDHMKYVVTNDQTVKIDGVIESFDSEYDKTFENEDIILTEDFLQFEHTDGLNYVNFEINRVHTIASRYDEKIELQALAGFGLGIMFPRSDVSFLHYKRNDEFHITGFGSSIKLGLNLVLFKGFTILSEIKTGYINMPAIHPTSISTDRAKQSFFFLQHNILFGGIIQF